MLSTETLLRDGRYGIGHAISSGRSGAIYTAQDQITKQQVAIIERVLSALNPEDKSKIETLTALRHDGLVRISDHFEEGGRVYSVTEPINELEIETELEAAPHVDDAAAIFDRLTEILLAMNALRTEYPSLKYIEIMPENVIETADGKLKLLFVESSGILFARNPNDSPYLPFERVWDNLDLISQRAFYRDFDDQALEVLESPPDVRSDLYSLGAVFYKLLTGRPPMTAFERSFEMLDSKRDPLPPPASLNPAVDEEHSRFVMRMLEARREHRFDSVEDAIVNMPLTDQVDDLRSARVNVDARPDPADGLELVGVQSVRSDERLEASSNGKYTTTVSHEMLQEPAIEPEPDLLSDAAVSSIVERFSMPDLPSRNFETSELQQEATSKKFEPVAVTGTQTVPSTFATEPANQKGVGFPKLIGLGLAGVFASAIVGWGVMSLSSSGEAPDQVSADQPTTTSPAMTTSQPTEQISTSGEAVRPVQTGNASPPISTENKAPENSDDKSAQPKPRPQTADARRNKSAQTKPEKPEKPAKKITVDDLINDN